LAAASEGGPTQEGRVDPKIGHFVGYRRWWVAWVWRVAGNLVGDADAVASRATTFLGVIGDDADIGEAEVDQDLRANALSCCTYAGGQARDRAGRGMKVDLRQGPGVSGVSMV